LWDGKTLSATWRSWLGDATGVFALVLGVFSIVRALCRRDGELVVEHLVLRRSTLSHVGRF